MEQALTWLICLAPVAALFAGIAFAHMKVPMAAGIGLCIALIAAVAIGGVGNGQLVSGAAMGAPAALSILYAVWPAMFLYDILRESGAFLVLRRFAESVTQDRLALIVLFGWVFSSFLQSITGFGVPVAVCAPFLVALGVRPVPAVIMTLIGHSWGNTYGTLGMAWDALVQMGPVAPANTAATALLAGALLWVVNLTGGAIVAFIYGGGRALVHGLPLIAVLSTIMGGGQMAVSQIDTTVACFLPATAALLALCLIIRIGFYRKPWDCPSRVTRNAEHQNTAEQNAPLYSSSARDSVSRNATHQCAAPQSADARSHALQNTAPQNLADRDLSSRNTAEQNTAPYATPSLREVALCASPFAFLTIASVLVFVVPGVRETVSFAQVGGIQLIGHAGFVLVASCLFALAIMTHSGALNARTRSAACKSALSRLWGASAGIVLLVIMARIMQETGQMGILAEGVAAATDAVYIPFAPAMGTFGAFVTSSNMSSNILLAGFQHAMAGGLGVDPALLLAAQTAGGAAGAAIGPSPILLGAATVGATGKEGNMLKPLLAVSFAQAALLGIIVWGIAAA